MLVLLISFSIFVLAIPPIPHAFEGNVYYSDGITLIGEGYIITAMIGDFEISADIINGKYDLMVESDGGTIEFYISEQTEAIGNYPFASSHITELDFTTELVNPVPEPSCGDSICNNEETCSTCSEDCGVCRTYDDDDDNGGSPGGGSPSGGSPTTTTSEDGQIIITAIDETSDEENETIDLIYNENQETIGPGITGEVIGFVKSGVGMGLIFAVLVLIVGIGVVTLRKKKSSVKKEVEEEKEF